MIKGLIALDIDGTVTDEFHSVPDEVVAYISRLAQEGWKLVFITGRSYQWGSSIMKSFHVPYYLAVQNGAIILEMPSKKIVRKKYLTHAIFEVMDDVCLGEASDYVIYSGYENDDICYYRPSHFSSEMLAYLKNRVNALQETYQPVVTFLDLPLQSFPSIKCFGDKESAARIAGKMEGRLNLHVTPVQDPFNKNYYVAQATHPEVSKGHALKGVQEILSGNYRVIAAGNDYNDASMFALSDLTVVMGNSPADLLEVADIIAPPVGEMGIIAGLQEAISRFAGLN